MPRNNHAKPTATQAAQMEEPGPDRDRLLARADELFEARGGISRQRAIEALERTMEDYHAGLVARAKDPKADMPVGVREGLRATLAIDKAYASMEALMDTCVQQAREEFYRDTGRRIAEQVWTFDADTPPAVRATNATTEIRNALRDQLAQVNASQAALKAAEAQASRPEPTTTTKAPSNKPTKAPELAKAFIDKHFQNSMIQSPTNGNGKGVTKS